MQSLGYWTIGAQFLRLAHESCVELINSGNKHVVLTDSPLPPEEYGKLTRWSDHSVGISILFNFFHGIELVLKGFLAAKGKVPPHHRLTDLLRAFEASYPDTALGASLDSSIRKISPHTPLGKFLAANSIQIDGWYESLKYPESKSGQPFTHFDLKYGGSDAIPFWTDIYKASSAIHSQAAALSSSLGLA